jgi:hypothetical protein
LSPDNRSLAILSLTDYGSSITFYHGLNKEEADSAFDLPGGLILDIRYLPNGDVLAISTDSLLVVDRNGEGREIYGFSGGHLGGYVLDGSFISLHLLDYGIGHRGKLVTIGGNGTLLGEIITDREIVSMSYGGGYLAAFRSDSIVFFDATLEEFPASGEHLSVAGASRVLALGDGAALAAGDNSAIVFRVMN